MPFQGFFQNLWDATWHWVFGLPTAWKAFAAVASAAVLLAAFLRALGDIMMMLCDWWRAAKQIWKRITRWIWWYRYGPKYGVAFLGFDIAKQEATVTVKIHNKTDWKAACQWHGATLKIWQRVDGVKQPRANLSRLLGDIGEKQLSERRAELHLVFGVHSPTKIEPTLPWDWTLEGCRFYFGDNGRSIDLPTKRGHGSATQSGTGSNAP